MSVSNKKNKGTKINTLATILLTSIITLTLVLLLGLVPGIDFFRYYASGYTIKRSAKTSPARTVLWEQPKLLPGRMNEVHGNNDATISPDGKTIILTRSYSQHNKDLYVSYLIKDEWSKPKSLKKINTEFNEISPEISDNGNLLLFSSDRPGGAGGFDIWYSKKSGVNWDKPILLDSKINTKDNEIYPYIADDMLSFYFSSDRPNTNKASNPKKNFNIFLSSIDKKNKLISDNDYNRYFSSYNKVTALNKLNSSFNEGKVAVTDKGNMIFFSSNRPDGVGGYDLYKSYLIEDQYTEPYNFGKPVNTKDDEISPTLSLEGFGLFFTSNYGSRNQKNHHIYTTSSREVLAKYDYSLFTNLLLIIIFILLAVFVIWVILRLLVYKNSMKMIVKCLIIALLLHLLFAYLSAFWFLAKTKTESRVKTPEEMTININTLARESIATAIREGTASLPKVKSASSTEKPIEKVTIPTQRPTAQADSSVSWQATLIKLTDAPVTMTKSKSTSEVESPATSDNSISSVKPVLSGATNITLESPEGIGDNEAAPKKGQAKGLPNPSKLPKFKQKKRLFKPQRKQELDDAEITDIAVVEIKPAIDMGKDNSKIILSEEANAADGKNTGSETNNDNLSKILGKDSVDAGWPSEAGSLFIQNDFVMITPKIGKGSSQQALGLLLSDKRFSRPAPISYSAQMNNFMIKRILLEREIIKSLYRFVNFDVIQKSHADELFNERVGNIIYTATPNFIIETDSELELPEKYLSK